LAAVRILEKKKKKKKKNEANVQDEAVGSCTAISLDLSNHSFKGVSLQVTLEVITRKVPLF